MLGRVDERAAKPEGHDQNGGARGAQEPRSGEAMSTGGPRIGGSLKTVHRMATKLGTSEEAATTSTAEDMTSACLAGAASALGGASLQQDGTSDSVPLA